MKILTRFLKRWKKTLLILGVVFAIAIGPYFVSRVRSSGRRIRLRTAQSAGGNAATFDGSTLTIATYNIAHGRGPIDDNWAESAAPKRQRVAEIAALLKETHAEIVVLNEVDFSSTWSGHHNQAEAIAMAAGYPYWVEQRNLDFRFLYGSWKFGNAILSKYPITAAQHVAFPALRRWESWLAGHKCGVVATVQLAENQQVQVLAVHIESRSENIRVRSVREIATLAGKSSLPMIVAGDFNFTPTGFPESEQSEDRQNAMDTLFDSDLFRAPPVSRPTVADFTYSTKSPSHVIDWILIPKRWAFIEYDIAKTRLSDHRPVVATIRITPR